MDKGTVHIYCGKGKGKTTAAIGQAIKAACEGRNVVIIEFLKAKEVRSERSKKLKKNSKSLETNWEEG